MLAPALEIPGVPLIKQGKVRDIYDLGEDLLLVASDRLSAFDVILPTPIPGKGAVLTELSRFWFRRLTRIIPNHLSPRTLAETIRDPELLTELEPRSLRVRKAKPLPVEAIVRGYLSGSGWKEYREKGAICGIPLPAGLRESDKLPEPVFTPSTKAEVGVHDENISYEEIVRLLGPDLAAQVRALSLELYREGAAYARSRGIIIADTKFEFGLLDGKLILIDEVLTPDSSRFWPLDRYQPGRSQPSYDKQYVRDWLIQSGWDKTPPGPELPAEVVAQTAEKYQEALMRLTAFALENTKPGKTRKMRGTSGMGAVRKSSKSRKPAVRKKTIGRKKTGDNNKSVKNKNAAKRPKSIAGKKAIRNKKAVAGRKTVKVSRHGKGKKTAKKKDR